MSRAGDVAGLVCDAIRCGVVIHYSCNDFNAETPPRVWHFAYLLLDGDTSTAGIIDREDEADLFSELAGFLKARKRRAFTTWKWDNVDAIPRFGWSAIRFRADRFGVKLPIPPRRLALADHLKAKYGHEYAPHDPHGRLKNLADLNNVSSAGWIPSREAGVDARKGVPGRAKARTIATVNMVATILRLEAEGRLRIAKRVGGKTGGTDDASAAVLTPEQITVLQAMKSKRGQWMTFLAVASATVGVGDGKPVGRAKATLCVRELHAKGFIDVDEAGKRWSISDAGRKWLQENADA